ncbi:MAG: discoidin domain-containing protein, partial [Patescibacteria group bacterium]
KNYSIETLNSIPFNSFLEGQVLFIVCISVSLILILTGLVVYLKNKKTALAKNVFLGILLVLVNTPIFALSPERSGIVYVLDSRNLYIPVLGSSIFIVVGLFLILKQNIRKTGLILLPLLLVNMYLLFNKVNDISQVGMIRKSILQKASEIMPVFPRKAIVYTESDKSFYALPEDEKIFPFQSGFGQTLLIWYFDKQKLPKEFLENRFLWELTSEGYKEFQGTGFGYFRNFEKMADTLEDYKLPLSSVISFRYDSKDNSLEDMSREVRGRIKGYLVNKKLVDRRSYFLVSSTNNKDVGLAKDRNINTFWSSQIPYAIPQSLEVSFKEAIKIAQIQIDSHTNKDQGEVGYKISVKNSENQLETVYYSKSRTPKNGIADIFFEPTLTNYVKIEQVGYHKFAPWVIHEIKIYAAAN